MAYVKNIKVRRATGSCCEDCRCGGNGCPGCPETVRSYGALSGFDIQACVDAGGDPSSCATAAENYQAGAGGASSPGSAATPGSSSGSGIGSVVGNVIAGIFGPKTPVVGYPPGYQPGMDTTTQILLLGGGALLLVLLLRKKGD